MAVGFQDSGLVAALNDVSRAASFMARPRPRCCLSLPPPDAWLDAAHQGPVSLGRTTTRPGETPSLEPILLKFFFLLSGMAGQRRCIDRGGYIDGMGYTRFAGILGNNGNLQKRG